MVCQNAGSFIPHHKTQEAMKSDEKLRNNEEKTPNQDFNRTMPRFSIGDYWSPAFEISLQRLLLVNVKYTEQRVCMYLYLILIFLFL